MFTKYCLLTNLFYDFILLGFLSSNKLLSIILKFLTPDNPQTIKLPPVFKLFTIPFDLKQTGCEANVETSYPT